MAPQRSDARKRFWAKVSFGHGPNACWTWTGSIMAEGYGGFFLEKTPRKVDVYARRYMLDLLGRGGEETHHSCSNRACVNPAHLVAISKADHRRHHNEERGRGSDGRILGKANA